MPKDTNENDKSVSENVKTENSLKRGDPIEGNIHGSDLIEQAFSSN